jgi:hypothetical protein
MYIYLIVITVEQVIILFASKRVKEYTTNGVHPIDDMSTAPLSVRSTRVAFPIVYRFMLFIYLFHSISTHANIFIKYLAKIFGQIREKVNSILEFIYSFTSLFTNID